jgi:hypothetical protein
MNALVKAINDAAGAKASDGYSMGKRYYTFEITPEGRIDISIQDCWDEERHPEPDWIEII